MKKLNYLLLALLGLSLLVSPSFAGQHRSGYAYGTTNITIEVTIPPSNGEFVVNYIEGLNDTNLGTINVRTNRPGNLVTTTAVATSGGYAEFRANSVKDLGAGDWITVVDTVSSESYESNPIVAVNGDRIQVSRALRNNYSAGSKIYLMSVVNRFQTTRETVATLKDPSGIASGRKGAPVVVELTATATGPVTSLNVQGFYNE